jgi:hypothetical protein
MGAGLAAAHGSDAEILARIQNYLGNGGLFNPEAMEHGYNEGIPCPACDLALVNECLEREHQNDDKLTNRPSK